MLLPPAPLPAVTHLSGASHSLLSFNHLVFSVLVHAGKMLLLFWLFFFFPFFNNS